MRKVVAIALLVGCGAAGTEALDRTSEGNDAGREPAVIIGCGDQSCEDGVCAIEMDGSSACFRRGEEPSFENGAPWPWPSLLLYCDGDEDCTGGLRCVLSAGEIFRADCRDETESCPVHVGHLCASDGDCHSCPNPGDPDRATTCQPIRVAPAVELRACSWAL